MKKLILLIATIVFFATLVGAQSSSFNRPRPVNSLPPTPCSERDFVQIRRTHKAYLYQNALLAELGASSGGGGAAEVNGQRVLLSMPLRDSTALPGNCFRTAPSRS